MKKIKAEISIKEYTNGDMKMNFKGFPKDIGIAIANYLLNNDNKQYSSAYCAAICSAVEYYKQNRLK